MKNIAFLILVLMLSISLINAQTSNAKQKYPEVGKPSPDYFFKELRYSNKNAASIKNFQGKWLIIDCWNRHCAGCIHSFPRTDSMARHFSDKIQFLLVGYTGTKYTLGAPDEDAIKKLYEGLRAKENLSLPIVYDSTFFDKFDISGCPFIIIIDPKGEIRGITFEVTQKNLEDFIRGGDPVLPKVYRQHEKGSPYMQYHPEEKPIE